MSEIEQKSNRLVVGVFALLLGGLGIHRFMIGKAISGLFYLVFCWTFIPSVIGFIEGVMYLTMTDKIFNETIDKTHPNYSANSNTDKNTPLKNSENKCPYCAELIKLDAKICKHCGKFIHEEHFNPRIIITDIGPDSLAKQAGLKKGDLIKSYNKIAINGDSSILNSAITQSESKNENIEIEIIRLGEDLKIATSSGKLGIGILAFN